MNRVENLAAKRPIFSTEPQIAPSGQATTLNGSSLPSECEWADEKPIVKGCINVAFCHFKDTGIFSGICGGQNRAKKRMNIGLKVIRWPDTIHVVLYLLYL